MWNSSYIFGSSTKSCSLLNSRYIETQTIQDEILKDNKHKYQGVMKIFKNSLNVEEIDKCAQNKANKN